ncbi:inner membrane-spanning protein YciB [Umboniibacter marinipuniceus]|uniref:Inner membrane-spanning protein YciB n=1 Tax=Umboniibacter marinipuniceus TaxID=569599 RepID=A0A3M0AC61_9GAMM|nr:inner membrane-spanning protein YciB [Umboniibacter marinipuniceus]RMA81189.1 intracellular septation protein [Umboniibacter marinipuniceus]
MKQLFEFIPLVLFFLVYQADGQTISLFNVSYTFDGIYSATWALMISSVAFLLVDLLTTRKVDKRTFWTTAAILILGSVTLLLRSAEFIQWKPTLVNWALALGILVPKFMGRRSWLKLAMQTQLSLPNIVWSKLEWTWIIYLGFVGALNLIVAYNFSEATWVSFKFYSSIGFSVVIMAITAAILLPALKEENSKD